MIRSVQLSASSEKAIIQKNIFGFLSFASLLILLLSSFVFMSISQAEARSSDNSVKLSALVAPGQQSPITSSIRLFNSEEQGSRNIEPFTKWTSMLKRYEQQMFTAQSASFKAWFERLEHLKDESLSVKMRQVNNIVNLNRYVTDQQGWKMGDHWATPIEFIARGYGDCEDYAITKMMVLKALGVSESQMRIAVVNDQQKNIPHAVLVVYDHGQAYVLDNQNQQVLGSHQIAHYKPLYSISRVAWWRHTAGTQTAMLR